MKKKTIVLSICSVFFLSMFSMPADSKEIIGWLEMIRVYPGNLKIRAKMDTGAKGSAINAFNVKKFERDNETWVSFELRDYSKKAKTKHIFLEKKVVDSVRIKRKGGGLDERLVVNMDICLGGVYKEIRMSLMDRTNFNYQVLIGRVDLKNTFIVDPSATFTRKPLCKMPIEIDK
ncbi:RimK/LysX family protein [uncultured Desulfobacter sp.]|uniref:ATP-dependent zinc protease family protein n=1 Tax=uncultured Desulfobacter sp. TaxID=240139 RepID=UPI002AA6A987|nr:RimK/LysX family protein [uncultured Desulfobacter sp.]